MLAVLQRVTQASVRTEGRHEAIGRGVLVLLGVAQGDGEEDANWLAEKCATLRFFNDAEGKMNIGLDEIGGEALVISQFTLLGDCEKGRRPSFSHAAPPEEAERLYESFVARLSALGIPCRTGVFGAMMQVSLVNDGPVTLLLDSRSWKERRQAKRAAKESP
ncbi:MAG: D-aminoacyl-tRNA deacylase [Candidatus Eisenbacteria bacterium]|nr:D-aminoacyl-tRNA deacylase [Candidatus Eisenbacteria bacterium]